MESTEGGATPGKRPSKRPSSNISIASKPGTLRERHAELAQSALRHASIETTHESYSDMQAAETAQQVDDPLDE